MKKAYRLRKRKDFSRVYHKGKSVANRQLVLYFLPNDLPHFRLGISVSKKIGRAVLRNRLKRLVREAVRSLQEEVKPGHDLIFIVRMGAREADFHQIVGSVTHLLKKSGLLGERKER